MQILRLPAVMEKTGLARSTIYALAATGSFPSPIKLGARASGWLEQEIETWLATRIANR
ncbi:MAG TPA: AlpA family transcriptional regulator [Rhodocyclaceae bacterium]|nr:AlpA family transcriptional regulator [Rhodocyclaceae bacterium]